jgi:ATP-dependent Clp protease ATP-binding subunit ClpX
MTEKKNIDYCSFCNKNKDQVAKLIVGHDVAICNECVDLCESLLKGHKVSNKELSDDKLDPQLIKNYLDQFVIGQDHAKIVLSVAIVNHYKRIQNTHQNLSKANILMIGPTGTGKTLLAKTVARYLNVPFVIADATTLTEAGYVGDDVETLIQRLYASANGDIELAQRGIIFVDEIDKISRKSESSTVSRDVSGEGVQQALLKLVEGTKCRIPTQPSRKSTTDYVEVDTTNILFIAGGAFIGLDNIVNKRIKGTTIGFAQPTLQETQATQTGSEDIVKYGMIPEFVGRFPTVVTLRELSRQQLIHILTQVKNNFVDQYKWLFDHDGVDLEFDRESIEMIVDRTLKNQTGARGLHSEIERVLLPHMYNLRNYKKQNILRVLIDKNQVNTPTKLAQENE